MKRGEFNWTTGIFIIGYHLLVFALFPLYVIFWEVSLGLIITTIVAGSIANFTITAGYHRYFAHRTYELNKIGERIVLMLGALSVQGSVLQWAHDHRIHHRYVDTDLDPYSIKKGFWYAHMGWLIFWEHPAQYENVRDLRQSRLILHQHRFYTLWAVTAGVFLPVAVGALTGHMLSAFLFSVCARVTLVYHG